MLKALWVAFLVIVWFFTLVMHSMVFQYYSFRGIAYLLGLCWLIYLAGLWLVGAKPHHRHRLGNIAGLRDWYDTPARFAPQSATIRLLVKARANVYSGWRRFTFYIDICRPVTARRQKYHRIA